MSPALHFFLFLSEKVFLTVRNGDLFPIVYRHVMKLAIRAQPSTLSHHHSVRNLNAIIKTLFRWRQRRNPRILRDLNAIIKAFLEDLNAVIRALLKDLNAVIQALLEDLSAVIQALLYDLSAVIQAFWEISEEVKIMLRKCFRDLYAVVVM